MGAHPLLRYVEGMKPVLALRCALVVVALCGGVRAFADDVDLEVSSRVPLGTAPAVTLHVHIPLRSGTVDLKAPGASLKQTLGPVDAGHDLVFKLPHKTLGRLQWSGTLAVTFDDKSGGTLPLSFSSEIFGGIDVAFVSTRKDIVDDNRVAITMSGPCDRVDVEVTDTDGELLASTSKAFDGAAAGTTLTVDWLPRKTTPIACVEVTAHDTSGAFKSGISCPWQVDLPHEDVEFESGKSDVRTSEEPKLLAVLPDLTKQASGVERVMKKTHGTKSVKLLVAGHTDTVGSSSSNRALSEARASSIARWFRKHGVTVAVYARGFGEDVLKVETPDETPEPRNRRAEYTLTVDGSTEGYARVP